MLRGWGGDALAREDGPEGAEGAAAFHGARIRNLHVVDNGRCYGRVVDGSKAKLLVVKDNIVNVLLVNCRGSGGGSRGARVAPPLVPRLLGREVTAESGVFFLRR